MRLVTRKTFLELEHVEEANLVSQAVKECAAASERRAKSLPSDFRWLKLTKVGINEPEDDDVSTSASVSRCVRGRCFGAESDEESDLTSCRVSPRRAPQTRSRWADAEEHPDSLINAAFFASTKASKPSTSTEDTQGGIEELLQSIECYKDLGVSEALQSAICSLEPDFLHAPAPVLPILLSGRDAVCQSSSLTTRTLTALVGAVQRIEARFAATQVLFLASNRSRLSQVWRQLRPLAMALNLRTQTLRPAKIEDIKALVDRPQLVIGTPGSIRDAIQRGNLGTRSLLQIIVDDVEKMSTAQEQVKEVFRASPPFVQFIALSASPEPAQASALRQELTDVCGYPFLAKGISKGRS